MVVWGWGVEGLVVVGGRGLGEGGDRSEIGGGGGVVRKQGREMKGRGLGCAGGSSSVSWWAGQI